MTNVKAIAKYDEEGMTVLEAVKAANAQKATLLSNWGYDLRLVKTDEWKKEKDVYPAWTGTFIAYGDAGEPLGKEIRYECDNNIYLVKVPKKFQKLVNHALVIEHGIIKGKPAFEFRTTRKVHTLFVRGKLSAVKIHRSDDWYAQGAFGLPIGEKSNRDNPNARYWGVWTHSYVGLVSRWYVRLGDWDRRDVGADIGPVGRLGVLVGGGKMPKHKHVWRCEECGELKK